MIRDFDKWLSKFKTSISDYEYYVDFNKIYKNVDKLKVELNILNSLIGSKNIEKEFKEILIKYPETLKCIPLLLAVRSKEIFIKDEINEYLFDFRKTTYSIPSYVEFMRKSGLFELIQNHIINNLYDYVLGIEVGLDSNGRKNRGGHLMEKLVEKYIIKAGYKKDIDYFKEMTISKIEEKWGINLSPLTGNNISTKRFDYVIKTKSNIYLIETNFYSSGGSKLNETARSYKMLAIEAKKIKNVKFVWFTDGLGWKSAKNNLQETFNEMDTIYNIDDLEHGIINQFK